MSHGSFKTALVYAQKTAPENATDEAICRVATVAFRSDTEARTTTEG